MISRIFCPRFPPSWRTQEQSPVKPKNTNRHGLAHREGRTRSLQIVVMVQPFTRHKSLTLYPIELGGR
jgi:hypothetical protein